MDIVVSSIFKATSWFRGFVIESTSASSLPSLDIQNEPSITSQKGKDRTCHSAPAISVLDTARSACHLDRLKSVCSNAFGGKHYSKSQLRDSKESMISDTHRTLSRTASTTYFSAKSEETNFVQRAACRFTTQQSVMSGDSGIYMESDSVSLHMKHDQMQNNRLTDTLNRKHSIHFENDENEKEDLDVHKNKKRFVENNHPPLRTSTSLPKPRPRSYTYDHMLKSPKAVHKRNQKQNNADKRGRIKLSLQFYSDREQLRIILIRSDRLPIRSGFASIKTSINWGNTSFSETTRKVRIKNGEAEFKNDVYINTGEQGLCGAVLSVKVYKISKFFRIRKAIGEVKIPLEELDLTMDTTFWVNLSSTTKRNFCKQVHEYKAIFPSSVKPINYKNAYNL